MPSKLNSTVRLFADDTIAYLAIKGDADADTLQQDLDKLAAWEEKWKMEFHPGKCTKLSITRNKKKLDRNYLLHGHVLENVDSAKYLGVTLQSDLRWSKHIDGVTNKASRSIGFLRRNLKVNSRKIKETAYKSLVRPLVEYAAPVWDPHTAKDIKKVEMTQRRAARYVTNRHHNTSSVSEMLHDLNWRSLEDRRRDARLTLLYRALHGKAALCTSDLQPATSKRTRYRHDQAFLVPHCSQDYRKYSFVPRTISDWNRLPQETVSAETVDTFKAKVSCSA